MKYTIDAKDKAIGRVATQAAVYLMGKNLKTFQRNNTPAVTVQITNVAQAKVTGNKMSQKTYSRYSGYPGGLKQPTMTQVVEKKGMTEVFRNAISGMLPKNKLRQKMMNNLIITE